jgi:hypothetical protein
MVETRELSMVVVRVVMKVAMTVNLMVVSSVV